MNTQYASNQYKISTFYHFTDFHDYESWRAPLKETMIANNVFGTILIAPEGLNATISGPSDGVEQVLRHIKSDTRFADLFVKHSWFERPVFDKALVRLKKEIITLRLPSDASCITGLLVEPEEWNELLDDPDVLVLDTRNDYETRIGTFKNAHVWPLKDFQELPDLVKKHIEQGKKVAMFCTGGVRCEKLSSWMMLEGYENLFQLNGGIIHYLNTIPKEKSKWIGECYVFDDRVAVGHDCEVSGEFSMCPSCGETLTPEDRARDDYLPAIHCRYCS